MLDHGFSTILPHLGWLIVFGIYPLITGYLLSKQGSKRVFALYSDRLVGILCWTFLAWLGLAILFVSVGAAWEQSTDNTVSPNVLAGLFVGAMVFFGGSALLIAGMWSAREVSAAPIAPQPRKPAEAIHTWYVVESGVKKRKWRLCMYPDVLQFQDKENKDLFEIPRTQAANKISMHSFYSGEAWMNVLHTRHGLIRIDEYQKEKIQEWIGPLNAKRLKEVLRRQNRFCLAFTLLYMFVYVFPLPDLRPTINEAWTPVRPEFVALWVIGVTAATHFWPHRMVFLIQGGLIALLGVIFAAVRFSEPTTSSILWVIIISVQVIVTIISYTDYKEFADIQLEKDTKTGSPVFVQFAWAAAIAIIFFLWSGLAQDVFDFAISQKASHDKPKLSAQPDAQKSGTLNPRAKRRPRQRSISATITHKEEYQVFRQAFPHYGKPEFELAYQVLYADWRKRMAPNGTWRQFLEVYKEFIDWWVARNSPRESGMKLWRDFLKSRQTNNQRNADIRQDYRRQPGD
jgi:hypothetical protein